MTVPTRREAIEELLGRGESLRAIGRALGISDKTVRTELPEPPTDPRESLNRRLRRALLEVAEADSQLRLGRPLTADELQWDRDEVAGDVNTSPALDAPTHYRDGWSGIIPATWARTERSQ